MLVNADFSRRVIVTPDQHRWVPSPQPGVERVMLDRLGGEKARATSLVRYAPASCFPAHQHPGGEEILVLSGTFSEGDAHHPAGCYLRNPPGSSHQPASADGAMLFVKLWQMAPHDTSRVRIDTLDASRWQREGRREVCPLFTGDGEQVRLQRVLPGDALLPDAVEGAELLVLDGEVAVADRSCGSGSWLRLPAGRHPDVVAGPGGVTVYLKTGPLGRVGAPPT